MEQILENLTGFILFGSVLWFWIFTSAFILVLFLSDIYENGYYAFVSFLVFLGFLHFKSNLDMVSFIQLYWYTPLIYLGVGVVYAMIRTYFYGRKPYTPPYVNKEDSAEEVRELKREALKSKLKNNVFRWWFLFPVSLINWIFTDLLKDFFNAIYSKLRKVFEGILDMGINSVSVEDEKEEL
tara:strand:- start:51256 stop:51801 length:546 start_codon:yes stop_codon:yes gene_type:complete